MINPLENDEYLIDVDFSAKSAVHHQAAAHRRGVVQGEGEGGRE